MARRTPLDRVKDRLAQRLSSPELERLPAGYFRIGDVLILDVPLPGPTSEIAEAYAHALGMRSVLGREGRIEGEFRRPTTRLLWGDPDTTTLHTETGIRYRLDPARIMWSQGNLAERQRVARWDCRGETVVDCFAGVGYFTLPLALGAGAARVFAIEKNPEAHRFLVENVRLNAAEARVLPVLGDCRDAAPAGQADRVLLGYLPDALEFVPTAVRALKSAGGTIHVHRAISARTTPEDAFGPVHDRVASVGRSSRLLHIERVKSYGPGREHVVLDVEVRP